jgi:hypothetical protein
MRVGDAWKSDDSAQFLRGGVLNQLPQTVQDLLFAASTLSGAGPFSADILAVLLSRPAAELIPTMSLLVKRQILSVLPATSPSTNASKELSQSMSSVLHTFSHDQWIEASHALCPVNQRAKMYHTQANRLNAQEDKHDVLIAMNLVRAHELGQFSCPHEPGSYVDTRSGYTFMPEEKSHYSRILIIAARQELSMQKGAACLTYLLLASDLQDGNHSAELNRVFYDCFVFENRLDRALQVADALHEHAETDEDHLEAAAMQLRCLYQLDLARGIGRLYEVTRTYAKIDLEGDALIMGSRDVFRDVGCSPRLPDVVPAATHLVLQGILGDAVAVAWGISAGLAVAIVWHCIQIAQVRRPLLMLSCSHPKKTETLQRHGAAPTVAYTLATAALFCCDGKNFRKSMICLLTNAP